MTPPLRFAIHFIYILYSLPRMNPLTPSTRPSASLLLLSGTLALALSPAAQATVLTFDTSPRVTTYDTMPQDYGDFVAADSQLSANGAYQNLYQQGAAWTPQVDISYATSRPGEFPQYFHDNDPEWPGVCFLWSWNFRGGKAIGDLSSDPAKAMPVGFAYYFTLTPSGGNQAVVLNSFVLNDYAGYGASVAQVVEWRVVQGSPTGTVIASGTETMSDGQKMLVSTGMNSGQAALGPLVLVIRRMAGTEDDLALDDLDFDQVGLPTTSYNSGTLASLGDGANSSGVALEQPGAIAASGDFSTRYGQSERTLVPFQPELNPASNAPFTIEFWANPTASDDDDAPVFNRISSGDRSGWAFFQRAPGVGWNLRMYDGVGSNVGWDLTGGTATFNAWSHVVATWNGSSARLYVNGALASSTNASGKSGKYNASSSATFSVGAYDNGGSPYNGCVDDIAFYPTALSATTILSHYQTASSQVAGAYRKKVLADGAIEYLQQNPPTAELSAPGAAPSVSFTGILAESTDLTTWSDLQVTSPYLIPAPLQGKRFFRSHR